MKKQILLSGLILFLICPAMAQWAVNKHFSWSSYGYRTSLSVDNSVYVSGNFIGPYSQPDSNDMGGFLMKYNTLGVLQWQKVYYSASAALRTLNATDSEGNVFVSGGFTGNMQFDNSMFSGSGMFLLKYDSDGNLLFSYHEPNAQVHTINIDPGNNIYVTGTFNTDQDSVFHGQPFNSDTFIAKYDKFGNFMWIKDFFCYPTIENAFDLCLDLQGNIYTTGAFSQFGDLFVNDSVQLINSGDFDGFIAKYDSNANLQWVKTITGSNMEIPKSIDVSADGSIYIGGYYASNPNYYTHIFDSITIYGNGDSGADIFIAKYDVSGNCQWVRTAGGNGNDFGRGVYVANNGNVYMTGYYGSFGDSIVFEGSNGDSAVFGNQTFYCPHGQIAVFVAEYDTNGNLLWVDASHGGQGYAHDITGNGEDELYITGGFLGEWNFGELSLIGDEEMYLMKLDFDPQPTTAIDNTIEKKETSLQLYPNPTSGNFQLIYSSGVQSPLQLTITNTLGVRVYTEQLSKPQGTLAHTIDLSNAGKGIYFVEITAGDKREVKKLILN